jgi:hypothetical protein
VAGTVVAWKPVDYDNFALKLEDIGALVWLIQEKQFATGFVVLATINGHSAEYIAHRDVHEVYETLSGVPPRTGPHGKFYLLREDFLPLDAQANLWALFDRARQ